MTAFDLLYFTVTFIAIICTWFSSSLNVPVVFLSCGDSVLRFFSLHNLSLLHCAQSDFLGVIWKSSSWHQSIGCLFVLLMGPYNSIYLFIDWLTDFIPWDLGVTFKTHCQIQGMELQLHLLLDIYRFRSYIYILHAFWVYSGFDVTQGSHATFCMWKSHFSGTIFFKRQSFPYDNLFSYL